LAIGYWRAGFVVVVCGALAYPWLNAQDEEFRVYTDHPRLILTAQRLRLLKRERERDSPRWHQFHELVNAMLEGGPALPEPGFALALDYAVSGDAGAGKRAIDWALSPAAADLRQLALVYDWCQPILTPPQSTALSAKIRRLAENNAADSIAARRDRVFALVATADDSAHGEEAPLRDLVKTWWTAQFAPALSTGRAAPSLSGFYALLEILHAIRDNLKIDLREPAPQYFNRLPVLLISANYPAPYRAPENDFRIPMYAGSGPPDLNRAALARAAGLAMVAFDHNNLPNQYLQGWLMLDRFSMFTAFGAPYEFLWANPYQPGLSYDQLPLIFHDADSGALFVRSSWDEDAGWFGLYFGEAELFHDGHVAALGANAPVRLGEATIIRAQAPFRFSMEGGNVAAVGLKPDAKYLVEADDEEMREIPTDPAGTLFLQYPPNRTAGVRIHQ
jgi:hypothetical protein